MKFIQSNVLFLIYLELFLKNRVVAHTLAKEIEDLKNYIKTCAYNVRLAMFLSHLFIQKSETKLINGFDTEVLRYANITYLVIGIHNKLLSISWVKNKCPILLIYSKDVLKDVVKSCTGHLSKKDIYSYISCESTGLKTDELYMVYRAILNTSSRKTNKSKKHKDQIEDVFVVNNLN